MDMISVVRIMAAQPGEDFNQVAWAPNGHTSRVPSKGLAGTGIYVSAIESVSLKKAWPSHSDSIKLQKLQGVLLVAGWTYRLLPAAIGDDWR